MLSQINSAFLQIAKRAEQTDPELLQKTFVDTGTLTPLLKSPSHQIIYGRRGTGKTHALIYAKATLPAKSHHSIFIDLRKIGMLRRSLFPIRAIVVKIAAIEQRSAFKVTLPTRGYLGFELGADVSADIDLDDFMVFGNDRHASVAFFTQLFYNHVSALIPELQSDAPSLRHFVGTAFTQESALAEVVRACEGVPRDAIHILGVSAQRAAAEKISIPIVRDAARTWYQRDKESPIPPSGKQLLLWIVESVIRNRKARAFLLERSESSHPLIEQLTDLRILHIIKKSISAIDQPGKRYDAYAIDYGCYVDLLSTKDAPQYLFVVDDDTVVEVPKEDYRSIRRAILSLVVFENR